MSDLITLRDPIDLVPVLELEPWNYARPERSSPARVDPEVFHEYWKASLEDAGIVGLEPLEVGSWFVPLDGIRASRILRLIVERWLGENGDDLDEAIDGVCGLSGGAALRSEGRTIVKPSCCACLDDIE